MRPYNRSMNPRYEPQAIEAEAQRHWRATNAYRAVEHATDAKGRAKPKYYACSMLPYPSGKLHMGHVRNYTINDVLYALPAHERLQRADADGLGRVRPAGRERRDRQRQCRRPNGRTHNIADMKAQMQPLGLAIDWSREIATCKPELLQVEPVDVPEDAREGHRLPQDAGRQLGPGRPDRAGQRAGDRRHAAGDRTRSSRSARSRATTSRSPSTPRAARTYLEHKLPGWPERVRAMQEHWIGKSDGVRFAFPHDIQDDDGELIQDGSMCVFTTRADTIMGVTFCAVAAEHPLAAHAGARQPGARRVHRGMQEAAAPSRPTSRRWKRRACRPDFSSRIR